MIMKGKICLGIFCLFIFAKLPAQELVNLSYSALDDVDITRDIPYVSYGDRTLRLDLYRPAKPSSKELPTIIVIRGGGFRLGDKEGFAPIAVALARRGFAAACIEFRTSGEALFPASIFDAKEAVRWVQENAKEHGLSIKTIGAIGGSSGAHLAVMLGVSHRVKNLNPNNQASMSKIHAVVAMAPPTDFTRVQHESLVAWLGKRFKEDSALWSLASPISHIDNNSPPMLFIHSSDDKVVPYKQTLLAQNLLAENGVHAEGILLSRAPHAFWRYTEWLGYSMDRAALFFHEQFDKVNAKP